MSLQNKWSAAIGGCFFVVALLFVSADVALWLLVESLKAQNIWKSDSLVFSLGRAIVSTDIWSGKSEQNFLSVKFMFSMGVSVSTGPQKALTVLLMKSICLSLDINLS